MTLNIVGTALILLATALCMVVAQQQYVPAAVYIPTFQGNQSYYYPVHAGNSSYNSTYRTNGSYPANYNGSLDGHLFSGHIQLYDRLLFNQVYRKESRWWSSRDKTIDYPQAAPAGYTRNEVISAIRIYNQFLDGNSARATILKGGVGYQYVNILLESKWGKGFQYLVQIYGH
ncbi:uncharacterized protein LOC126747678 isoform X2 [Anthonomus grandis grandis]|uniref:uncharacterized protein LOC126747678 isoform X2 n=1 Tax=Anthonomus grandis grandis TaxID=2921223 RepID=UPI002165E9B7|nr:uncharacterized protein LOC126747678 isoform X2 [Anthonomus grandis grandis]